MVDCGIQRGLGIELRSLDLGNIFALPAQHITSKWKFFVLFLFLFLKKYLITAGKSQSLVCVCMCFVCICVSVHKWMTGWHQLSFLITSLLKTFLLFILSVGACLHVCLWTIPMQCSLRPERALDPLELGLTGSYEPLCGCWEPILAPLWEQNVLNYWSISSPPCLFFETGCLCILVVLQLSVKTSYSASQGLYHLYLPVLYFLRISYCFG